MKKWLTVFLFGALLSVFGFSATAEEHAARDGKWFTNYEEAVKAAKEMKRPILMLFTGSDWCPYCIKLEKEVLSRSGFKKTAGAKFVLLYVDFPRKKALGKELAAQNKKLSEQFEVSGFPTTVVISADGKELGRIPGFLPEKEYLEALDKAHNAMK